MCTSLGACGVADRVIDLVADRPATPYEPASPVTVQTALVFDPAPAPASAPQAAPQLAPVASGVPEGFAPVPVTFSTASTLSPSYVDIVPASVDYVEAPASVEYISAEPVSAPVAESAEYVSIGALPDPDAPVPATAPGQLRPDLYGTALGDRPFVLPGAPGAF